MAAPSNQRLEKCGDGSPESGDAFAELVLIRHGITTVGMRQVFCGWLDPPLFEAGRDAAHAAGTLLDSRSLRPTHMFASVLRRARQTAAILATATGFKGEIVTDWRLNERHYGSYQGRKKSSVRAELGDRDYLSVHRSYRTVPPPATWQSNQALQQWYDAHLPGVQVPDAESLEMVRERVSACWQNEVRPALTAGCIGVVVAHSNSLRALIMEIENLDEDAISTIDVPVTAPLVYEISTGIPVGPRRFLEPERAWEAVQAMRHESE